MGNRSSLLEFLTVKDRPKEGCAIYRTDVALSKFFMLDSFKFVFHSTVQSFEGTKEPLFRASSTIAHWKIKGNVKAFFAEWQRMSAYAWADQVCFEVLFDV
jgi:hypothetical protein